MDGWPWHRTREGAETTMETDATPGGERHRRRGGREAPRGDGGGRRKETCRRRRRSCSHRHGALTVPSRPVSRSLFSHSFSSPVIRKAQGGEANRERPSAVDVSVDGDRVIRDVDPTFLRSACHASASSPRAF